MENPTKAVVAVPHKGSCIVVVYPRTILRASGFMGGKEAQEILQASTIGGLMSNANFIGDVLATKKERTWSISKQYTAQ